MFITPILFKIKVRHTTSKMNLTQFGVFCNTLMFFEFYKHTH